MIFKLEVELQVVRELWAAKGSLYLRFPESISGPVHDNSSASTLDATVNSMTHMSGGGAKMGSFCHNCHVRATEELSNGLLKALARPHLAQFPVDLAFSGPHLWPYGWDTVKCAHFNW